MDIIGAHFFYQSLIIREDNRFVVWNYCPKALPTPSVPAFRNISSFRNKKKQMQHDERLTVTIGAAILLCGFSRFCHPTRWL